MNINRSQKLSNHCGVFRALTILTATLILAGCDRQVDSKPTSTTTPEKPAVVSESHSQNQTTQAQSKADIINTWVTDSFTSTINDIDALSNAGDLFYRTPNPETLIQVKRAWQKAHSAFSQTALLFSLSKASPDLFYSLDPWQSLLDADTIEPGYLDSFDVYTHSGIVNDTLLTINAETLRNQHQLTHSDEIALGFHALEFLIWGDNNNRPLSMFIANQTSDTLDKQPKNRRRRLIRLLTRLLFDDIKKLQSHWHNSTQVQLKRLSPLSQVQLWKQALAQYWQEHTVEVLRTDQQAEQIHHTKFAGETADQHALTSLATLSEILKQTTISPNNALYSASTQTSIEQLLSELKMLLAEYLDSAIAVDNSVTTTTETEITTVAITDDAATITTNKEFTDTKNETATDTEQGASETTVPATKNSQPFIISETIYRLLGY